MGTIHVSAERHIDAPPGTVYGYIANLREHHPRFLPPAFTDFQVESGGVGRHRGELQDNRRRAHPCLRSGCLRRA